MSVSVRNLEIARVGNSDQYRAGWKAPTEKQYIVKKFRAKKGAATSNKKSKYAATKEYKVVWSYDVLDHDGGTKRVSQARTMTTTSLNDVFNAPSEALAVYVSVTPVSRAYTYYTASTKNGKTTYTKHDDGKWFSVGAVSNESLSTGVRVADPPEITSVDVDGRKITVKVKSDYGYIERFCLFVYLNGSYLGHLDNLTEDKESTFVLPDCANSGRYQFKSRVLNRSRRAGEFTGLTDVYEIVPATPTRPPIVAAGEGGKAKVTFDGITTDITKVHVQYVAASSRGDAEHFFAQGTDVNTVDSDLKDEVIATGLEPNSTYYFRYRTENSGGESEGWSPATFQGFCYGTKPDAPTVWSDKSVYATAEEAVLNWVHNSTDDSVQTWWEVTVKIGDSKRHYSGSDQRSCLDLDLSGVPDGTRVTWCAKTKGVGSEPSPPSEAASFMVWEPPQVTVDVPQVVDRFPIEPQVTLLSQNQDLLLCDIGVSALYPHEIMRADGELTPVYAGEAVYASHDAASGKEFAKALEVGELLLADGQEYELQATCVTSSGLTATASKAFTYDIDEAAFSIGADVLEVGDKAVSIAPYALYPTDDGSIRYAEGVRFSVFRSEPSGKMVALVRNMPNDGTFSYTDRHAPLSRQAYRVVAIDSDTGLVAYEDFITDHLRFGRLIFSWSGATPLGNGLLEDEPAGDANVVEIPYDIGIQENGAKDMASVQYIGKDAPDSRYGTQLGETATWTCSIPRGDSETLSSLRRLKALMRDVYVREPLGASYFAMVDVGFHASCDSAKIDVTIDVTRTSTAEECVVM